MGGEAGFANSIVLDPACQKATEPSQPCTSCLSGTLGDGLKVLHDVLNDACLHNHTAFVVEEQMVFALEMIFRSNDLSRGMQKVGRRLRDSIC